MSPHLSMMPSESGRYLVVSLHDVHPGSLTAYDALLDELRDRGVPRTSLLAVPRWHGSARLDRDSTSAHWLRNRALAGHEVVLHGYRHVDPTARSRVGLPGLVARVYTEREGEFYALSSEGVARRLSAGCEILRRAGLAPPIGFVPPAWLVTPDGLEAARISGLSYATTLRRIVLLQERRFLRAPVLAFSSRSAWRRLLSLAWGELRLHATARTPILRIAFHPADLAHATMRRAMLSLVARARVSRVPITYTELTETCKGKAMPT